MKVLGLVLWMLIPSTASAALSKDEAGIRQAAEKYIAGVKGYDENLLKDAFHPSAHIKCVVKSGEKEFVLSYLATEWVKLWAMKEHPADEIFKAKVVSVEKLSDDMAAAKLEMSFETPKKVRKEFTDSLALVRLGGEWRILNKVCTSRESKP